MSGIEQAARNKPFAALIHDLEGVIAKMSEDETSMRAAARGSLLAEWRSSALGELSLAALDAELKWTFIPGGMDC
jgi:hypothetical protein